MKILIDMNLSPGWCQLFREFGWEARHWSEVGDPAAPDQTLMTWARAEGYVVFTHDLDFGAMLAATQAEGPSVIQVRTQDVMPERLGSKLLPVLRQLEPELIAGALVILDESRWRVRILPLRR